MHTKSFLRSETGPVTVEPTQSYAPEPLRAPTELATEIDTQSRDQQRMVGRNSSR